jgi:F-type H+-transporting ATPase subunit c
VSKAVKIGFMFLAVLLLANPAWAQTGPGTTILAGAAIGAGFVTMGAAYGIGKLASAAYESMARQPEVAGRIFPALIIAAALIEGFTFYALYICSTAVGK